MATGGDSVAKTTKITGIVVGIAVCIATITAFIKANSGVNTRTPQQSAINAPQETLYVYNAGLATNDVHDLDLWARAQPTHIIGGSQELHDALDTHGNQSTMQELLLSRRIVELHGAVRVNVLSADRGVASVEVASGIAQGARGYVAQSSIMRDAGGGHMVGAYGQPLYPQ